MEEGKNYTIYLSGGGDEHQSFLFDEQYFSNLPKNAKLLYIPVALRGHELYAGAPAWVRSLIDLHRRQDVEMETRTDLNDKKFSDLERFNTIFIGGGNTWSLIKEVKESGFDKLLVEFLASRGSIYGGSAGAIILGKRIITHDENTVGWKDRTGLDLLRGYSVACHYKQGEKDLYQQWAKDNDLPIFCLPEETGGIVSGHKISIIGNNPCLKITPNSKELIANGSFTNLS